MFTTLLHFNNRRSEQETETLESENKQSFWSCRRTQEILKTFEFSCKLKPTTQYFHLHTVNKIKAKGGKKKKNPIMWEATVRESQQVSDLSFSIIASGSFLWGFSAIIHKAVVKTFVQVLVRGIILQNKTHCNSSSHEPLRHCFASRLCLQIKEIKAEIRGRINA